MKQLQTAKGLLLYVDDKESLEMLFADIDDPQQTMEAIISKIIDGNDPDFGGISTWEEFRDKVDELSQRSQPSGRGQQRASNEISVLSWRKFKRIINKATKQDEMFANRANVQNGECRLADALKHISAKGGRLANVEVHGGATLEETVVPIIELTLCKCLLVNIFAFPRRSFACHDLRDKLLLILQSLIAVRIERTLCNIAKNLNILVLIALSDDSSGALLQICRSPRNIEVMDSDQPFLDVCVSTHFHRRFYLVKLRTSVNCGFRRFC